MLVWFFSDFLNILLLFEFKKRWLIKKEEEECGTPSLLVPKLSHKTKEITQNTQTPNNKGRKLAWHRSKIALVTQKQQQKETVYRSGYIVGLEYIKEDRIRGHIRAEIERIRPVMIQSLCL